jgi:hypothetical protein
VKTVIFAGPSIPEAEIEKILPDVMILPPAEQGDIDFARYQLGADVIGLIDGKHTMVLPPLHKEILSVLTDGCRVIGAASMGALRAVECEDYGAEPIGEVAKAYKTGEIDGDDEVCLVHGDKNSGYKHLSVPMVNIRATISVADLNEELKEELIAYAKSLFYPDRDWQNIFEACDVTEIDQEAIQSAMIDIKRADSLHLCYHIAKDQLRPPIKKKALHAHYGFAAAFENNDRKILHRHRVIRKHQIASASSNYDRMNARNRALALELCEMLGIKGSDELVLDGGSDLTPEENNILSDQEIMLNKAGEWIVSRCSSSDVVRSINDFLRISGRYEATKENIL